MARIRYNFSNHKGPEHSGGPKGNLVVLGIFLFIGLFVLCPLFLPFGVIWCAVIGKALADVLKREGIVKKNVEGKYGVDWNKAKASGSQAAREVRSYSADTARRYKNLISEGDRMEESLPYKHPHTPVHYSYDQCAVDRRLEQIKALKEAGILDESEYRVRKERILAGK